MKIDEAFMRLIIVSCLTCLAFVGNMWAVFEQPIVDYEVAVGYRHDNFRWSMSGLHNCPNVLWKMDWKTVRMVEISGSFSWATCSNYYTRINADWGTTFQSESRSSGYRFSDECGEYSRIKGKSNDGHAMDFTGGVGYQFTSSGRRVVLAPLVGWAYHSQKFEMSHGVQEINRSLRFRHLDRCRERCCDLCRSPCRDHHEHLGHHHHDHHHHHIPRLGKIKHLSVSYHPHWHGPFIGIDVAALVDLPCTILSGTLEYHWSQQYRARGRWKLDDIFFNSFRHHTNGRGVVANIGLNVNLGCGWWFGATGFYRNFKADKGHHRSNKIRVKPGHRHQIFGTFPVIPIRQARHTKLKGISWNSWSVSACLDYRF